MSSPVTAPHPAPSPSPIFDEVDRWWRDGGDDPTPGTMLTFSVPSGPRRPVRTFGARHQLEA